MEKVLPCLVVLGYASLLYTKFVFVINQEATWLILGKVLELLQEFSSVYAVYMFVLFFLNAKYCIEGRRAQSFKEIFLPNDDL